MESFAKRLVKPENQIAKLWHFTFGIGISKR